FRLEIPIFSGTNQRSATELRCMKRLRKNTVWVKLLVVPLLMVAAFLPAWSQQHHYSFKSYTRERGLTNLGINALLQDRTGFIWAGTQNGLFWYDGSSFRELPMTGKFSSTAVEALHESADGTLWVATKQSLLRRRGSHLESIDAGFPLQSVGAGSLTSDQQNRLYVA